MFNKETLDAVRSLLLFQADDHLIIGHRNSEWTGLGPILEEDIAFSSIAQDKIGHALGLYAILNENLGEAEPDTLAFMRNETDFTSCHLVELPIGEYDFSLVRHLFFDLAAHIRFEDLATSSFDPVAKLARKVKGSNTTFSMPIPLSNSWVTVAKKAKPVCSRPSTKILAWLWGCLSRLKAKSYSSIKAFTKVRLPFARLGWENCR